jgi:hypothetical protein
LESAERGEWRSVKPSRRERGRYVRYARETFKKDRRVNIRISTRDLEAIQKRALEEASPAKPSSPAFSTSTPPGVYARPDRHAARPLVRAIRCRPSGR